MVLLIINWQVMNDSNFIILNLDSFMQLLVTHISNSQSCMSERHNDHIFGTVILPILFLCYASCCVYRF
jgi:hypothetical protein